MKRLLYEAVVDEMKKSAVHRNLDLGYESATAVDKKYLIDLLATLNNQHRYFARDY